MLYISVLTLFQDSYPLEYPQYVSEESGDVPMRGDVQVPSIPFCY